MKQWRKNLLCKKAEKLALISYELADLFLKRNYLESFFDKWSATSKFQHLRKYSFIWCIETVDGKIHKFKTFKQASRFMNKANRRGVLKCHS